MAKDIKTFAMNDEKRNILLIALSFPPNAKVGAKRFHFLMPYLSKQFNIDVISLHEKYYLLKDHTLKNNGKICRIQMYPPYPFQKKRYIAKFLFYFWNRGLALIDPFCGSIYPGIRSGRKIIQSKKIDTIIATGPPFSSFIIGYFLSKEFKVKLVLDYRDPWTTHQTARKYSYLFGKSINKFIENKIVANASAIVVNTRRMRISFEEKFSHLISSEKIHIITNGFTYQKVDPIVINHDKINLIYAGSLYGNRNLKNFLFALSSLDRMTKKRISVHIFGSIQKDDLRIITALGLESTITEHAQVPYNQYLRYLKGADIMLIILGEEMDYAVSYKMYDFLCVQKPVLAIVPNGSENARFVKQVGCGEYADINDPVDIRNKLERMINKPIQCEFKNIEEYTWKSLGNKYVEIITSSFVS
jgi:glycosyltransferase involved in cell wall biosynthesis